MTSSFASARASPRSEATRALVARHRARPPLRRPERTTFAGLLDDARRRDAGVVNAGGRLADALVDSREVARDLRARERASDDAASSSRERRRDASARVQRDLALRLLEAQAGWVASPSRRAARAAEAENAALRRELRRRDAKDAAALAAVAAAETAETDTTDAARPAVPSSLNRPTVGQPADIRAEDLDNDLDLDLDAMDGLVDADATVVEEAWTRGRWLLGLLVLQSSSSVVLQQYADLVRENIVITLFLTMLVGAGGNAGNQSAIRVIRGLATGEMEVTRECALRTVWQQARVGGLLGAALSVGGFARVMLTDLGGGGGGGGGDPAEVAEVAGSIPAGAVDGEPAAVVAAAAISLSLFAIVTTSTVAGTALPFALAAAGQDPANAGTTIQVCMDILGVVITCAVCSAVFAHFGGAAVVAAAAGGVVVG